MEVEGECVMRSPYYTHIQLLAAYIVEVIQTARPKSTEGKLSLKRIDMPSEEVFVLHISGATGNMRVKILQMVGVFKLYVLADQASKPHIIWFNRRSFVKPSISNTLSRKLIFNERRLQAVFNNRVLGRLDKKLGQRISLLQTVLDQQLQAVAILKYLPAKDLRNLHLACFAIYESINSKTVYKALYEARFGRTGFGMELEWKTFYFNKIGRFFL